MGTDGNDAEILAKIEPAADEVKALKGKYESVRSAIMKSKIQTKMLSIILSAVTIISLLTVPVSAASSGDCGYYPGTVTYTLDDEGLLTISGEESTSAITMTESDDACTFTVTANVNEAAYAYAALYNVYGGLISVKSTPIALYCPSTGKTYDYTATFENATMCGIRPDVDKLIVEHARSGKTKMTIPLPESPTDRTVTIDANYEGGEVRTISCLNDYWKNGDGLEKIPSRTGYEFIGWYTEQDGGDKIESLTQLDVTDTVYAQWLNKWEITKEPTFTSTGTAYRKCESITELTETVLLPVLSDTSFWTVIGGDEPTYHKEGWRSYYNATYGKVRITLPIKDYDTFDAEYMNGKWWIVFPEAGEYKVICEAYDESGVLTSSGRRKYIIDSASEAPVILPSDFVESGTIKVKVYENMDAEEPVFEFEYEATQ